jgi:hypothetical protein
MVLIKRQTDIHLSADNNMQVQVIILFDDKGRLGKNILFFLSEFLIYKLIRNEYEKHYDEKTGSG